MSENEIRPARRFAVKKDADNHYIGMEVHSLGAYVLYGEHQAAIDRLTAERDAAVADAERRLQLIRDTLANTEWRHGARNIYAELSAEVRAIDAARAEGGV